MGEISAQRFAERLVMAAPSGLSYEKAAELRTFIGKASCDDYVLYRDADGQLAQNMPLQIPDRDLVLAARSLGWVDQA